MHSILFGKQSGLVMVQPITVIKYKPLVGYTICIAQSLSMSCNVNANPHWKNQSSSDALFRDQASAGSNTRNTERRVSHNESSGERSIECSGVHETQQI